jgi:holo-[acyl-carrier protein] synthase
MLGCDIIGIERIRKSYAKYGKAFLDRILTEAEQKIFFRRGESMSFLAGRFAAKEAVAKAFKTGIGRLAFTDIDVRPDEQGAPVVYLRNELAKDSEARQVDIELSISHCKEYAMAVCIRVK